MAMRSSKQADLDPKSGSRWTSEVGEGNECVWAIDDRKGTWSKVNTGTMDSVQFRLSA